MKGSMRLFPLSVAGALMGALSASVASADETPDKVRAAALFAEGRRLMAAEEYAAACPKLAESQALDPAPDTAFDLGICYQKASQAAFKVAHDLARPPEQGGGAVSAPSRASAPEVEASPPGQTQRVVGLTIGGAGVAGIVAGVISGLMAKSAYDNSVQSCSGNLCGPSGVSQRNSAVDLARASNISLVTGAVALGAGAVVFFTAPKSKPGAGTAVGLGPAGDGAAGLSVAGRF
jgi:hypothetical protein